MNRSRWRQGTGHSEVQRRSGRTPNGSEKLHQIILKATLLSQRASVRFRTRNPVSGREGVAPIFECLGKVPVF